MRLLRFRQRPVVAKNHLRRKGQDGLIPAEALPPLRRADLHRHVSRGPAAAGGGASACAARPLRIRPARKETHVKESARVVLYPERAYRKKKWPASRFLEVRELLGGLGVETALMRPPELDLPGRPVTRFHFPRRDRRFLLRRRHLLLQPDSGMARFGRPLRSSAGHPVRGDRPPDFKRPKNGLVLRTVLMRRTSAEAGRPRSLCGPWRGRRG